MKVFERIVLVAFMTSLLAIFVHVTGFLMNLAIFVLRFAFTELQAFTDTVKEYPITIAYLTFIVTVVVITKKIERK